MNTITLLGTKKRVIVNRFENEMVVMEGISDKMNFEMEQEQRKYGKASFKSFNHNVPTYDVLLFGKINFSDKKDTKLLKKFESRLWDVADISHFVYSNMDYETGIVYKKDDDVFKGYQTMNIITWLKHCHVVLGKPKYICIYKYPRGKFQFHCPQIYKQ
jgi:hypothetical protein